MSKAGLGKGAHGGSVSANRIGKTLDDCAIAEHHVVEKLKKQSGAEAAVKEIRLANEHVQPDCHRRDPKPPCSILYGIRLDVAYWFAVAEYDVCGYIRLPKDARQILLFDFFLSGSRLIPPLKDMRGV